MHIAQLKDATAEDHVAVEGSVSLMSDTLARADYLSALERMFGIVAAWESFAEVAAPPELSGMVRARARRVLLEGDISALGGDLPSGEAAPLPYLAGRTEFLAGLYVMEGSRMGGQFIARHVAEVLQLEEGHGTAYFRGFGDKTGSMWKELVAVIEREIPDDESERAIVAAKQMFHAFGDWMRG